MRSANLAIDREMFTCLLEDAIEIAETGDKAHNLGRMLRLGMNVPPGFVLKTPAFHHFLGVSGLESRILEIQKSRPLDFGFIARAVREMIQQSHIPAEISECVEEMRRALPPDVRLIVRSSAVGEDGSAASFAGQLDSIPDVQTPAELERALLQCWSSYWSERALFYQNAKGVHLRGMGVVFQVQVESTFSGVLFTRPPARIGSPGQLYAEYCTGPGEALVSGRVTPGRLEISRESYRCTSICAEEQPPLKATQIEDLARSGVKLEEYFGAPQDVEWTIDRDGRLFLLQTRPITVGVTASSQVLWSNSNVNENFPEAITPFLYSIAREGYYHYFRNLAVAFGVSDRRVRSMEQPFRHIIGVHHSHMYYNLTSIHSVLRQAPFGETLATFFNQFVGATELAPSADEQSPSVLHQAFEATRIAFKTICQYTFLERRIQEFEHQADRFAESTQPEILVNRSLVELRNDLRRFMEIRCNRWLNASLADAAAMVSYGLLQLVLGKAYPSAADSALHNNLLKGLTGVASVRPTIRLWDISRQMLQDPALVQRFGETDSSRIRTEILDHPDYAWLRKAIDEYLGDWGYRFSGELMLTVPSFQENQVPLFDLLKTYLVAQGASPLEAIERLESQRIAATKRILEDLRHTKRLPRVPKWLQGPLLRVLLRATRCSIQMRERARSKQALLYSRCRRIALAIGARLTSSGCLEGATDVFFATYAELDDLLSGHAMFPRLLKEEIALRKGCQKVAQGSSAPDTFWLAEGEYFQYASAEKAEHLSPDSEMRGIGACGGKVSAPATVLESVDEAHLLRQGDILVTRQTDPGWGPVFFLIRGLVIERGGMLSHGAIIAREFGLPCVVGVKEVTRRIPQRCQVTVDGDHGYVQIVG